MEYSDEQSPLRISAKEMRQIGYQVIDEIVDHFDGIKQIAVLDKSAWTDDPVFKESIPETGKSFEDILDKVRNPILSQITHTDHPRFLSYIPGPSNFISVMSDLLATGFNVFAGHQLVGRGPARIEELTIEWLRTLYGFPESADGLFLSGGSAANLTALAIARNKKSGSRDSKYTIYCSDQTHSSITKAIRVLGFRPKQLRKVPSDEYQKMKVDSLIELLEKDLSKGLLPMCIVANAGTTNTGTVDPLEELAETSSQYDTWLHVDGAYGAAAVLTKEGEQALCGIEQANSLTLDPHKWWFQPYEIGCLLVRDWMDSVKTFSTSAEYLTEAVREGEKLNYFNYGIQLTRHFRALKLWMSIKYFGLDAFRQAISHGIHLAEYAQKKLHDHDLWEVVTLAQLGIVTFRYNATSLSTDDTNRLIRQLVDTIMEEGCYLITTTEVAECPVLRICTIHPELTQEDIDQLIKYISRIARQLIK